LLQTRWSATDCAAKLAPLAAEILGVVERIGASGGGAITGSLLRVPKLTFEINALRGEHEGIVMTMAPVLRFRGLDKSTRPRRQ